MRAESKRFEVNANETEEVIDKDERDERQGRGREETDEEASKRRKSFKDDEEEKDEEPAGDHEGSERHEEHSEQDGGDCRAMKKMINPRLPSREDVEIHEMTHLPFRNWCPHCIKGRGIEASHKRQREIRTRCQRCMWIFVLWEAKWEKVILRSWWLGIEIPG